MALSLPLLSSFLKLPKDCVKVASSKLVNPYHEFTISFGKGVEIGEVAKFVFLQLSLL